LNLRFASFLLLGLSLSTVPAFSQNDLYDNGPTNGTNYAWTITFGFAVSDSFLLSNASTVNSLDFASWVEPGFVLETSEVAITSSEFGGTTYFDQTVSFVQSNCTLNDMGYNVCLETGSFPGINLPPGTYWLTLKDALGNRPGLYFWDENAGPSLASENSVGTIPSESFTVNGHAASTTTPEPTNIALLGSGLLGIAWIFRRRLL